MDTQQIELVGRNWLINELLRAGLEVARPERDHGIDLIAYADLDDGGRFIARPIQLKAASARSFGVMRRYEQFHDLLLAYVWHVASPSETVCYCLTYPEAEEIARQMGWTETASWAGGAQGGRPGYTTSNPSAKLEGLLEPHRMNADRWRAKMGAALLEHGAAGA